MTNNTKCQTDYDAICAYDRQPKRRGRRNRNASVLNPCSALNSDTSSHKGYSISQHQRSIANRNQEIDTQNTSIPSPNTPTSSFDQDSNETLDRGSQNSSNAQLSNPHTSLHQIELGLSSDNLSQNAVIQSIQQPYNHGEGLPRESTNPSNAEVLGNIGTPFFEWPARNFAAPLVASRDSSSRERTNVQTASVPNPLHDTQQTLPSFRSHRHSGVSTTIASALPQTTGRLPSIPHQLQLESTPECRYPVLRPLLPYITSITPTKDACDLLEMYFAKPSNSLFECASPYVLTQIFREAPFLSDNPRITSPALLAAMLWATAQTSDAPIFKTSHRARSRICDELYAVCLSLIDRVAQKDDDWKTCML